MPEISPGAMITQMKRSLSLAEDMEILFIHFRKDAGLGHSLWNSCGGGRDCIGNRLMIGALA